MAGVEYIEVLISPRLFSDGESYAIIKYGQLISWDEARINRVKDANGMDKLFDGKIAIFNFLFRNGWVHEATYVTGEKGDDIHHLFRRKPTDSR